jgi:hypothetical protein
MKNEAIQDAEETFVSRSGRLFPVKYSVAPLNGGYQHGAVVEFRDISEEKQLEQEWMMALLQTEQKTERVKQEEKLRKQMGEFIDHVSGWRDEQVRLGHGADCGWFKTVPGLSRGSECGCLCAFLSASTSQAHNSPSQHISPSTASQHIPPSC